MDNEEYQLTQEMIMNLARQIQMLDIAEFLNRINRAETVGPILDPTLYREVLYSGKLEAIKRIAEGALEFKKAVLGVKDMVEAGRIKE